MRKQIDQLHDVLACAELNGLFDKDVKELDNKLKESLRCARDLITANPPKVSEAWSKIHDFCTNLRGAEQQRGLAWNLRITYGVPAWVYLLAAPFIFLFLEET